MPTSSWHQLSKIMDLVIRQSPKSILDVGVGFGKWGMLCREYLDIYRGRYYRRQWQIRIDGIEIFESYRMPGWELYNKIIIGDIVKKAELLNQYELILLIDIIEHLERSVGVNLLKSISTRYIVATPAVFIPQGATFGNENERHKSLWYPSDFPNSETIAGQIIGWN